MNSVPGRAPTQYRLAGLLSICALLLLALAGCGASASGAGGPQPTTTRGPGSGLTILPCTGSYSAGPPPAAILGSSPAIKATTARAGDAIEVRMDIEHVWKFEGVTPSGALTVENENGMFDRATGVCVWRFQASATGVATITFTGRALCDPNQVCPQYIIRQTYSVTVS